MARTEYFRKYRNRKQEANEEQFRLIQEKLDFLIASVTGMVPMKPEKPWKPVGRQEVKTSIQTPLDDLARVNAVVDLIVKDAVQVCAKCGCPAFYKDDKGMYCASHSTRDSKPI